MGKEQYNNKDMLNKIYDVYDNAGVMIVDILKENIFFKKLHITCMIDKDLFFFDEDGKMDNYVWIKLNMIQGTPEIHAFSGNEYFANSVLRALTEIVDGEIIGIVTKRDYS